MRFEKKRFRPLTVENSKTTLCPSFQPRFPSLISSKPKKWKRVNIKSDLQSPLRPRSHIASAILVGLIGFAATLLPFHQVEDTGERLSRLLEKAAAYCQRLENASLDFVCSENIRERIYRTRSFSSYFLSTARFFNDSRFVYDYQLIRKNKQITERRTLLEDNGKACRIENAPLKTSYFWHKNVVFGPIGLLGRAAQARHSFRMLKEDSIGKTKAVVIEAEPLLPERTDSLYGKVWIAVEDGSILKIEWNPSSMGNFGEIVKKARQLGSRARLTFASEYGFEKNGLRFPSRYYVKEEYIRGIQRFTQSETTVEYKDYRFFTVETDVIYKK